jgi:hypothetical protein
MCPALPLELTIVDMFTLAGAWETLAFFCLGVIIGENTTWTASLESFLFVCLTSL